MLAASCGGCDQETVVRKVDKAGIAQLQSFSETHRHCAGLADMKGVCAISFRHAEGHLAFPSGAGIDPARG